MKNNAVEIIEIDVCGQICPSSLLTTLREVNRLKQPLRDGEVQLSILTDNHDSTNRVSETVCNMGYQVNVEEQEKHYKITIAK